MFENIMNFLKKLTKKQDNASSSKETAKERLHLVLMQDRANVSADFLDLMRQEIIDVIKKYIEVDESAIDVRLTNKENEDGTNGAPALYANIPIINIKEEAKKEEEKLEKEKKENAAFRDGEKNHQLESEKDNKDSKESINVEKKDKPNNPVEHNETNPNEKVGKSDKEENKDNKEDKNEGQNEK